jgi:hypothetical protein
MQCRRGDTDDQVVSDRSSANSNKKCPAFELGIFLFGNDS